MKKELRWAMLTLSLLGLVGCGLKGPLYFPPQDKPQAQATPPDAQPQQAVGVQSSASDTQQR